LALSFHKAHPSWTPQSIADDFDQEIIPQIIKGFEKILHITSATTKK
jgi:hypothetical protein